MANIDPIHGLMNISIRIHIKHLHTPANVVSFILSQIPKAPNPDKIDTLLPTNTQIRRKVLSNRQIFVILRVLNNKTLFVGEMQDANEAVTRR